MMKPLAQAMTVGATSHIVTTTSSNLECYTAHHHPPPSILPRHMLLLLFLRRHFQTGHKVSFLRNIHRQDERMIGPLDQRTKESIAQMHSETDSSGLGRYGSHKSHLHRLRSPRRCR